MIYSGVLLFSEKRGERRGGGGGRGKGRKQKLNWCGVMLAAVLVVSLVIQTVTSYLHQWGKKYNIIYRICSWKSLFFYFHDPYLCICTYLPLLFWGKIHIFSLWSFCLYFLSTLAKIINRYGMWVIVVILPSLCSLLEKTKHNTSFSRSYYYYLCLEKAFLKGREPSIKTQMKNGWIDDDGDMMLCYSVWAFHTMVNAITFMEF